MTPTYVLDIYARRGFDAAMRASKLSRDYRLIEAVMFANFRKTGIAMPVPKFGKNKQGKQVLAGFTEGCSPEQLAALKAKLAPKQVQALQKPGVTFSVACQMVGNLTAVEAARRANALALARGN